MSARTARRRRKQAVMGYKHLAKIGRGNNNRPIYRMRSIETLTRRELEFRQRQAEIRQRQSRHAALKRKG